MSLSLTLSHTHLSVRQFSHRQTHTHLYTNTHDIINTPSIIIIFTRSNTHTHTHTHTQSDRETYLLALASRCIVLMYKVAICHSST
jgi:hypothetical protein